MAASEAGLWAAMANGTGVDYSYDPDALPTIYDERQCAEVAAEEFWGGHVADGVARRAVANLISDAGLANVTAQQVVAASAMEGRGFLYAVYRRVGCCGRRSLAGRGACRGLLRVCRPVYSVVCSHCGRPPLVEL